jgi:hyperosmotically inducible periplasmic protein
MRSITRFIAAAIAILTFSFIGVDAQGFSGGSSVRTLEQEVQRKINRLPWYEVFDHIGYTVNGNTVTLFGKVRNAVNKYDAENSVERIPGVDRVINNIEVLPVGSFDESIRLNLYRRLSSSGGLSRYLWTTNPSVRLIVDRGHVTLEGFVGSRGDYHSMNIIANGVPGVFSVTNNLVVNSGRAN